MMKRVLFPLCAAALMSGCAMIGGGRSTAPAKAADPGLATEFAPAVAVTPLGASGAAPAALDKTSAAEKAAALAVPVKGGERNLGSAVAALGPPAETGLWVQSVLIKEKGRGRVTAPGGKSIGLELRPGNGGALLSLSAYQALGLPLTDLPQITIYAE